MSQRAQSDLTTILFEACGQVCHFGGAGRCPCPVGLAYRPESERLCCTSLWRCTSALRQLGAVLKRMAFEPRMQDWALLFNESISHYEVEGGYESTGVNSILNRSEVIAYSRSTAIPSVLGVCVCECRREEWECL